jgi:hypothetical protein
MPKEDNCRCVLWQLDPEKNGGAVAESAGAWRKEGAESSTRFGARGRGETAPFTIPFTTHPCGWLLRVGLEGGEPPTMRASWQCCGQAR